MRAIPANSSARMAGFPESSPAAAAEGQRVGGAGIGARGRVTHPASPSGSQREGKEGRCWRRRSTRRGMGVGGAVGRVVEREGVEMFEQKARKETAANGGPAQQ
jgi:hypothetical protein